MSEIEQFLTEETGLSFEDRVVSSLAWVQGHWNQRSKNILSGQALDRKDLEEDLSLAQRIFVRPINEAAISLFGDGSEASRLLGHTVLLPEADRGLITLLAALGLDDSLKVKDWIILSLFSVEISKGKNIEEIITRPKQKVGGLIKMARRFSERLDPKGMEEELPGLKPEEDLEEMLEHSRNLSGGSNEAVLVNKNKLQEQIVSSLARAFSLMGPNEIIALDRELSKEILDDEILKSSFLEAKKLIQQILEAKLSDLTDVVSKLGTPQSS